jgi:hypothetical protein
VKAVDKRRGYFALRRGTFDEPLFRRAQSKRFSRRDAWAWLNEHAAWKPGAERCRNGVIPLERGQLAISLRSLGKIWGWPKSNVDCWLRRLVVEGEILLTRSVLNLTRTASRTASKTGENLITICNYNELQKVLGRRRDSIPDSIADSAAPELPGLLYEVRAVTEKHQESYSKKEGRATKNQKRPHHGKTWTDESGNLQVWYHHDTDEWAKSAADFESVRGTKRFPAQYLDGRGNWFIRNGERNRIAVQVS